MIEVRGDSRGYVLPVIEYLTRAGWSIVSCPADGKLRRNGQKVVLKARGIDLRFRLFTYKITGSGRDKPYERRIEITSTYQKGLDREPAFPDVVLGCAPDMDVFVGVDGRRIESGGPTGNASSFFDVEGVQSASADKIHIRQHAARLFENGVEFHSFLKPERLAEYFFNREDIHRGSYGGDGRYSVAVTLQPAKELVSPAAQGDEIVLAAPKRATRPEPSKHDPLVRQYEKGGISGLRDNTVSPARFAEILRRMEEVGRLGEEFVVGYERKRLKRAGKSDLAAKVLWVSQISIAEGYDVRSSETTGQPRYIEVKSSVGAVGTFEMSRHEWNVAAARGDEYWLYLVSDVLTKTPKVRTLRNPVDLEAKGAIVKTPSGWRVTVR